MRQAMSSPPHEHVNAHEVQSTGLVEYARLVSGCTLPPTSMAAPSDSTVSAISVDRFSEKKESSLHFLLKKTCLDLDDRF